MSLSTPVNEGNSMPQICKQLVALLSLAAVVATGAAHAAKGSGGGGDAGGSGGSNLILLPGNCSSGITIGKAMIGKLQNDYQFGIQVSGEGAAGTWDTTWVKNNQFVTIDTATYTSGWGAFGLAANKFSDKGIVTFSISARNRDTGEICTATGSVKI
jgi:hypothetical protein